MGELDWLLSAAAECDARGEPYALATVIEVRGSSYRRPGARLLVPATAPAVGIVSGGCLEGEAARLARETLDSEAPRVATIDHSAEGDEVWGSGLGCRGAIDLLLEPPALAADTVSALRTSIDDGVEQTLLTVLRWGDRQLPAGTRMRWDALAEEILPRGVTAAVEAARDAGRPAVEEEDGLRVAIDPIRPPMQLLVCGAGPDAEPLVRLGRELGWRVTVADWRRRLLDPAHFPGARLCDVDPALAGAAVGVGPQTAAVLMTHDFLRDAAYMRGLLGQVGYIGVLGPRDRTDRLLNEIDSEGRAHSSASDLREQIYAPAGLDLGADSPAEVAISIVAEILAVTRNSSALPLRERPGPIHHAAQPPM
jgi:xanthine dehydrogenase accessory factor